MSWRPVQVGNADGFLGLLGLKNTGMLPGALLEDVRATIDFERYAKFGRALTVSQGQTYVTPITGLNSPGIATGAQIVVPPSTAWWIHEVTASLESTGIEDDFTVNGLAAMAAIDRSGTTPIPIIGDALGQYQKAFPPGQVGVVFSPSLRDVLVPPGTEFGLAVGIAYAQNAGADTPFSASVFVRYTPFPI